MTPALQLTSLHLRVANLARSVDFYSRQLGFRVVSQRDDRAELSTDSSTTGAPAAAMTAVAVPVAPLLVLTPDAGAPRPSPAAAGLFHAALLLPSRAALARWLLHAKEAAVNFSGFSDHGVSEAIYLSDPDGNGLEFYADRPRASWPREKGELAMGTLPLDVRDLLRTASPPATPGLWLAGATWGHFHLRVTNLERSEKFYREALGVILTQSYGHQARFLAAEGYHHHLGLNTWGAPHQPLSPAALGLVELAFARADARGSHTRLDPDGIPFRLTGPL